MRWQVWAIGFVALLLFFTFRKNRAAAFFQLYVFVTFLPVIFLVNHREIFYWYIPMVGLCGLAALFVKSVVQVIEPRIPARITPAAAAVLFAVLCWEMYAAQRNETDARRMWQQQIAIEYRSWVTSVRSRPQPAANATVFFDSYPSNFNEIVLQSAAQVALRRTDIDAKLATREQ